MTASAYKGDTEDADESAGEGAEQSPRDLVGKAFLLGGSRRDDPLHVVEDPRENKEEEREPRQDAEGRAEPPPRWKAAELPQELPPHRPATKHIARRRPELLPQRPVPWGDGAEA